MTLDEQLIHFDRKAEQAYARCLRDFKQRKERIILTARERLIAGFAVYEGEGYKWDYQRLHAAELEEYSDGVNYRLFKMYQGWQ